MFQGHGSTAFRVIEYPVDVSFAFYRHSKLSVKHFIKFIKNRVVPSSANRLFASNNESNENALTITKHSRLGLDSKYNLKELLMIAMKRKHSNECRYGKNKNATDSFYCSSLIYYRFMSCCLETKEGCYFFLKRKCYFLCMQVKLQ